MPSKNPPRELLAQEAKTLANYQAKIESLKLAYESKPSPELAAKITHDEALMKKCQTRFNKAIADIVNEEGVENAPVIPSGLIPITKLKSKLEEDLQQGRVNERVLVFHLKRLQDAKSN